MRGVHVHRDIYVSVAGTDLVRLEDGRFVVLEDNLRVPSGVSYMLANREVTKRVLPEPVRPLRRQPDRALRPGAAGHAARAGAADRADPTIVVLTPGVGNSAYFEHAFLAREMGVDAGRGPRPARPRQRRLHADDGGPAARRRDLPPRRRRLPRSAGVPAPTRSSASPACSTPIAPATCRSPTPSAPASPTTRRSTPTCRRSSSSTSARSRSCRTSRPTCSATPSDRQHVLEHLDALVVKAVGESGGYGMLIGPHSTAARARGVPRQDPGRPAQLHRAADARAVARAVLHRRSDRAAPRRSAAVRAVRRPTSPSCPAA